VKYFKICTFPSLITAITTNLLITFPSDLLILDELGFKKIQAYSVDDFFEIISKRYEKGSVIITSNKKFEA
jgi:DNA replication protein DnaC